MSPRISERTHIWVRFSGTAGVSAANPTIGADEYRWGEVVPGSESRYGCQVHTYVFEILNDSATHLAWWPTDPGQATVALTAVGTQSTVFPPPVVSTGTAGVGGPALSVGPVPAGGSVRIALALPTGGEGTLGVYDVAGRLVRVLTRGRVEAGRHESSWDGRDSQGTRVGPGVYLVRFSGFEMSLTRRVVWLR